MSEDEAKVNESDEMFGPIFESLGRLNDLDEDMNVSAVVESKDEQVDSTPSADAPIMDAERLSEASPGRT
jgi:hypothetical protein